MNLLIIITISIVGSLFIFGVGIERGLESYKILSSLQNFKSKDRFKRLMYQFAIVWSIALPLWVIILGASLLMSFIGKEIVIIIIFFTFGLQLGYWSGVCIGQYFPKVAPKILKWYNSHIKKLYWK